jgi:hypothetical protein
MFDYFVKYLFSVTVILNLVWFIDITNHLIQSCQQRGDIINQEEADVMKTKLFWVKTDPENKGVPKLLYSIIKVCLSIIKVWLSIIKVTKLWNSITRI